MDDRRLRRARRRRRRQLRRRAAVAATVCAAALLTVVGFRSENVTAPAAATRKPSAPAKRVRPPARPPQFVVVSFDGAGGARLWTYWRSVAERVGARFTFFVSGVYLLDEKRRTLYRPPRHDPGSSDIGFAQPDGAQPATEVIRGTLEQIAAASAEGHEIGTHFNGHFCAPFDGSVGEWTGADWRRELDAFDRLLFGANENNRLDPPVRLAFGERDVVGARTPCLEGRLGVLDRELARRGYRYDASRVALLGEWPRRVGGLWSVPLLEIPLAGHTFRVVSMDYNLYVNQAGLSAAEAEREAYLSFRHAFVTSYFGNRAPLSLANHFETWNHWAYNRALTRFLVGVCGLREVRCTTHRELVRWLDAQPRARLRRAREGRFPRLVNRF